MLTKTQRAEQRKEWRQRKQRSRANLHAQKIRRVQEYDRNRKKRKCNDEELDLEDTEDEDSVEEQDEKEGKNTMPNPISPEAFRCAKHRVRKSLPRNSKVAAQVIASIIDTASPRKKKFLKRRCILSPKVKSAMKGLIKKLKEKIKDQESHKRKTTLHQLLSDKNVKYRNLKTKSVLLGVRYNWLCKVSRIPGDKINETRTAKAIDENSIQKAKDFYIRVDNSTCLPGKRTTTKKGPSYVLKQSLQKSYNKFNEENPNVMKRSKFCQLKPKNVKTVDQHKWVQCLCPKCANIELSLKAFKKYFTHTSTLRDKYDVLNLTLCEKPHGKFHNLQCIERNCSECGVYKFQETFEIGDDQSISWTKWQMVDVMPQMGKNVRKKMGLKVVHDTAQNFIKQFLDDLASFSSHMFVANWQHKQFSYVKENLKEDTVLAVADFAENFRHGYQDETSSMHWNYSLTTLHPVVCYYHNDGSIVQEDVIVVSDDLQHDCQSVNHFTDLVLKQLKQKHIFSKFIRFSDTAKSQYRSKNVFELLSTKEETDDIKVTYAYFGPHHGKGPADGAVAVVKRQLTRAVKSREVNQISTSEELFDYCEKNMIVDRPTYKRSFIFVPKGTIKRSTIPALKTVKGTQNIQCIKGANKNHYVYTRNLACFCDDCISEGEACENCDKVQAWKLENLLKKGQTNTTKNEKRSNIKKSNSVENKVVEGSWKKKMHISDQEGQAGKKRKINDGKPKMIVSDKNQKSTRKVKSTKQEPKQEKRVLRSNGRMVTNPSPIIVAKKKVCSKRKIPSYPAYNIIQDMLEPMSLQVEVMGTDGNCLFRAISHSATGTEANHLMVRRAIVEVLRNHRTFFQQYMDGPLDEDYLLYMDSPNVWGSQTEIFAAASLFKASIYVLTPVECLYQWMEFKANTSLHIINPFNICGCHIKLVNTNGNHYDLVVRQDGKCNCLEKNPCAPFYFPVIDLDCETSQPMQSPEYAELISKSPKSESHKR